MWLPMKCVKSLYVWIGQLSWGLFFLVGIFVVVNQFFVVLISSYIRVSVLFCRWYTTVQSRLTILCTWQLKSTSFRTQDLAVHVWLTKNATHILCKIIRIDIFPWLRLQLCSPQMFIMFGGGVSYNYLRQNNGSGQRDITARNRPSTKLTIDNTR